MLLLQNTLMVFGASFANAALSEFISWVLMYRKDNYQALKADIERVTKARTLAR